MQHRPRLEFSHSATRLWLSLAALLGLTTALFAEEPREKVPDSLRPYRVHVSVTFAGDPALTAEFRTRIIGEIHGQVGRMLGQMWDDEFLVEPLPGPTGRDGLLRVSDAEMKTRFGPGGYDKVFLLSLGMDGPEYSLAARQWDSAAEQLGPVETARTSDRRQVADVAFSLLTKLFEPVLSVDNVHADAVEMHLRAGEFPALDPELNQLQPGDLAVPFFRYLDRKGIVQKIQFLPWTYLVVDKVERGYASASLISGLQAPLGTGSMRLVEIAAVRRRPRYDSTQLTLVTQKDPPTPLVACALRVVPKLRRTDEAQGETIPLVTDRSGSTRVPVVPKHALVWLYINSGDALLARIPFAPGLEPSAMLRLPDDSARLTVEGEVELLKGRIVDAVARRSSVMARIRALAREGDWTNAKAQMAELDRVPGATEFQSQLNAIRVPAVERAQKLNERVSASRIEKLCSDASALIQRFLDPDRIRAFREEIQELQSAAASEGKEKPKAEGNAKKADEKNRK